MKTSFKFLALAVALFCLPSVIAQNKQRINPEEAEYAIRGTFKVEKQGGQIVYRLFNPTSTRNITFAPKPEIRGMAVEGGYVAFRFDSARTDYPGGFENNKLLYWYKNAEGSWIYESEVLQGVPVYESTQQMEIMLVLDCSGSIGNDFEGVKENAITFIEDLYEKTEGKGNVRVGLIGFSTIDKAKAYTIPIRSLTYNNKNEIVSKIRDFRMGNGTAFYYSVDKAIDMMQQDVPANIPSDKFNGAYLVAFTDGADNVSVDYDRDILDANMYYSYLRDRIVGDKKARIHGKPVEVWIVSVMGNDISSESQARSLRQQFNDMVAPEHHKPMSNINEMKSVFRDIYEELIRRNTVLMCYVPSARQGQVGWTFVEQKKSVSKPAPRPVTSAKCSPWIGISGEVGMMDNEFFGGANIDMTFSINDRVSVGGRLGLMYGTVHFEDYYKEPFDEWHGTTHSWGERIHYYTVEEESVGFLLGPEMKITFPNNSAILASLGGGVVNFCGTAYLRAGYKFKKSFYLSAEALIGDGVGFGVGAGFSFGGKRR